MEDVVQRLYELLKTHSDQVNKWIEFLKKVKHNIDDEDGSKCNLWQRLLSMICSLCSRQWAYQSQQEENTQARSPNMVDQGALDRAASDIQDTESKIKILEGNITEVLKSVDNFYQMKSEPEMEVQERKEEALPVVQVYARGDYLKDVVSSLTETLQHKFLLVKTQSVTDIDKGKPLLILSRYTSRLQPDLTCDVEEFDTLDDLHASIIVVHFEEEHALPVTSSQFKITGQERYKSVRLIDVAYTKASKFYPCNMNSEALKKLDDFVSSTETKHE